MVIERWLSSRWAVQFEHDGKMGTAGSVKGQSLPSIRKQLIEQEVAPFVEVKPFTLRQHFLQQGNVADATHVERVQLSAIRVRSGRVVDEIAFAGTSFIEGFLSVYGLELERAVKRYEDKLQLFEILEREQRKRSLFVGRLKHGQLEQLSPNFDTEQQAKKTLLELKQQREKERAPIVPLTMDSDEPLTNE